MIDISLLTQLPFKVYRGRNPDGTLSHDYLEYPTLLNWYLSERYMDIDPDVQRYIATLPDPNEAYFEVTNILDRFPIQPDWENVKGAVLMCGIWRQIAENPELRDVIYDGASAKIDDDVVESFTLVSEAITSGRYNRFCVLGEPTDPDKAIDALTEYIPDYGFSELVVAYDSPLAEIVESAAHNKYCPIVNAKLKKSDGERASELQVGRMINYASNAIVLTGGPNTKSAASIIKRLEVEGVPYESIEIC